MMIRRPTGLFKPVPPRAFGPAFRRGDRPGWVGVMLLVVLVAVAIMFAMVFMPGGSAERARDVQGFSERAATTFDMSRVAKDVSIYQLANGEPPAGMAALYDGNPRARMDPWENEMELELVLDTRGRRATEAIVRSAGPDGAWETDDDIEERYPVQ